MRILRNQISTAQKTIAPRSSSSNFAANPIGTDRTADQYVPSSWDGSSNLRQVMEQNKQLQQLRRRPEVLFGGSSERTEHTHPRRGVEEITGKKRVILNDALSLIEKATRGSKDPYFKDLHKNLTKLDNDGKFYLDHSRDGNGIEMLTLGEGTGIPCDVFEHDGTPEGRQRATIQAAVLLAHEWAHNERGPHVVGHGISGKVSPYRVQVRMGEKVRDYYQSQGRSQSEIDLVDEVIQGSITAGHVNMQDVTDFPGTGITHPKRTRR
jgi:hypothetical protein